MQCLQSWSPQSVFQSNPAHLPTPPLRCLQVCIDLFFLTQGYCDVATLSTLTTTTCGQIYHYAPFDALQVRQESSAM